MNAWQFFAKWAVLLVLIMVIAKTELGHRAVYYALWLMVVLLVVTHSQDIVNILNPGAQAPIAPIGSLVKAGTKK